MAADATSAKTISARATTADGETTAEPMRRTSWVELVRSRLRLGGQQTLRDTIKDALEPGKGEGAAFSYEEREMLRRMLHFEQLRVDDIMVPRADIIAIDESEPLSELLATFRDAEVSRLPALPRDAR